MRHAMRGWLLIASIKKKRSSTYLLVNKAIVQDDTIYIFGNVCFVGHTHRKAPIQNTPYVEFELELSHKENKDAYN